MRRGASRTGRWWEGWEIAPDSLTRQLPTTPKGDKLEKDGGRCGGVRAVQAGGGSCGSSGRGGSSRSDGRGGAVGAIGRVGIMGAVGGVKRGKLCQNLGTLTKFIIF